VLRSAPPELPPGLLQIIGGYAVMKANQSIGVPAESMALKWPNDVILHDGSNAGKVAGVLVEGRSKGTTAKIVMGIGVNFSHEKSVNRPYPIADLSKWLEPAKMEASTLTSSMQSWPPTLNVADGIKSADISNLKINLELALKESSTNPRKSIL